MRDSVSNKNSLSDKVKNSLINELYIEDQKNVDKDIEYSDEALDFKNKLNSAAIKMNVLNDDIFDFNIDTLGIIEKGDSIKEIRTASKEFILFILSSFIIVSLYAIAIIKIDYRILIISQIFIAIIAPCIIIPISVAKRKESEF
ncbi:hypothetical protein [Clostridium estertheticum]|uniref:Uncharacterized protein n=1 Tax=Clostridium estertheticum subsp. estertheticum TaxID=1552 RepID=A0A1J0GHS5_9CLOT|nr:hypothetical protein [Clostridium estertheticum]APC40512.1 hypothetical protein A7L45_10755 [Clostridium estertheticum subsp. estertheticum]MBZ9617659.1 hypothetical protein [Clostridium estertheticum subsp. laramiense]WAG73340.1 hypothetical protein LL032_19700 [Clostridium estertheticum]